MAYQYKLIRCGNKRCRSCPHGPYWYEARREGKRVKWTYIGKGDPRACVPLPPPWPVPDHPFNLILRPETATEELAYDVLGVHRYCDRNTALMGLLTRQGQAVNATPVDGLALDRLGTAFNLLREKRGWY